MAGKAVFRATARSARKPGYRLKGAGRTIQSVLLREFRTDGPILTRIFRSFAPEGKTHQVENSVSASQTSRGGRVGITILTTGAKNEDGFDYFDVTRHGRGAIVPKKGRVGKNGRPAALAFDGIVVRRVKPWKPARDWVESASHVAEQEMGRAANRIGRQIQTRII